MSPYQRVVKRAIDIVGSAIGLVLFSWLIGISWIWSTVETRRNGFFSQKRIGRNGVPFRMVKIRTMIHVPGVDTTATARDDVRVTRSGRVLRRLKIDELPQLWNVLRGDMSIVGPRPDVAGWADKLKGGDRVILSVRPGVTGPATLAFRDEEDILAARADSDRYNREVIYPAKVAMNVEYVETYSLLKDLRIMVRTPIEILRPLRKRQVRHG